MPKHSTVQQAFVAKMKKRTILKTSAICKCAFERNIFLKDLKRHFTFENEEQFANDYKKVGRLVMHDIGPACWPNNQTLSLLVQHFNFKVTLECIPKCAKKDTKKDTERLAKTLPKRATRMYPP